MGESGANKRSLRYAFAALALALIAIVVTSFVSAGTSVELNSAWATIIGAIIGFGALAVQSFMSLRSINLSHEKQSARDREAREELRKAELAHFYRQLQEERAALAFALVGELSAAYARFNNSKTMLKMAAEVYDKAGDTIVDLPMENILPRFEPSIYMANIQRLGILGPSVLSDVVEVFQMLIYSTRNHASTKLSGSMIAMALRAHAAAHQGWLLDQLHVQSRLLSVGSTTSKDPGPLSLERQKRHSAQKAFEFPDNLPTSA